MEMIEVLKEEPNKFLKEISTHTHTNHWEGKIYHLKKAKRKQTDERNE